MEQEHTFHIPESEITGRIRRVQKRMRAGEMGGLLIVQRVDLFYFTGTAQNGVLFIPAEGDPLLLVKKYMPRAARESPLRNVLEVKSLRSVPENISEYYGGLPVSIGFELDVMPVKQFTFFRRMFKEQTCLDGSSLILDTRSLKSKWEIAQMENTANLSHETFQYMRNHIRPGYTEMEFAGMFETYARKMGHGAMLRIRDYQTEGYPWHVLSGQSGGLVGLLDSPASGEGMSPAFPCGAGYKELAVGEPIMIDLALVLNGYHMDETRMFALGAMPQKALDASKAAIEIHNEVLAKVKPGLSMDALFQIAWARAEKLGYKEPFLGPPGYKVRFIGHGIGLELIEKPIIAKRSGVMLRPGMVFALEPKMVFENAFSAGIESVFQVTENGHQMISRTPVNIFIC